MKDILNRDFKVGQMVLHCSAPLEAMQPAIVKSIGAKMITIAVLYSGTATYKRYPKSLIILDAASLPKYVVNLNGKEFAVPLVGDEAEKILQKRLDRLMKSQGPDYLEQCRDLEAIWFEFSI